MYTIDKLLSIILLEFHLHNSMKPRPMIYILELFSMWADSVCVFGREQDVIFFLCVSYAFYTVHKAIQCIVGIHYVLYRHHFIFFYSA